MGEWNFVVFVDFSFKYIVLSLCVERIIKIELKVVEMVKS